jgi:hypothetical protein
MAIIVVSSRTKMTVSFTSRTIMMSTMKLKSLLKEEEVCLFTLEVVLTYVQPIYESTIDYYRR